MLADFDDFRTGMDVLISDRFTPLIPRVARPGPAPACPDAELITMALGGECRGGEEAPVLLSRWRAPHARFPVHPERRRFHRRRRALAQAQAINRVRPAVLAVLAVLDVAQDPQGIIDSLPVPVVRFYAVPPATRDGKAAGASGGPGGCSKKQVIGGSPRHLLLTHGGSMRACARAPANGTDLVAGAERLERPAHRWVLAETASISPAPAQNLFAQHAIHLTPFTC